MGWGVYKQPDALYSVWSTIVDDFIWMDCTADDIREIYRDEYGRSGMLTAEQQLEYADGTRPRPYIGDGPETFASRLEGRFLVHDDEPLPPEDAEWFAKMRALLEQEKAK